MKWIRCLSLFFVLLMCFASTDVGAQTINNRKFTIKNQNVLDAYCAYAYLLDEEDASDTENLPGLYVEGWVQIPSGRAVTIEYASNFRVLYYCLMLADGTKLEGKEKKTYSFSVPKDLMEDSFKVVHELNGGIIGAVRYTSVDESDLETQGFSGEEYEATVLQLRIGIPGPVEIKTEDAVEIVEFEGIKLQVLQEELERLRQELAHSEAARNALMEKIEHLEQIVKALENQLSVLQQHPDPKFDGVYDTRGFVRQGQDYALLFATDTYMDEQAWVPLEHPVSDAKKIQSALEKYGFTVELHANKTRWEIGNVLKAWENRPYASDDQLLVYFAGHGHYDNLDGYLVTKDSQGPDLDANYTTYYPYKRLKEHLDAIPCPNILLMVDANHSGKISPDVQNGIREKYRSEPTHNPKDAYRGPNKQRHIKEKLNAKTRWYLTSGGNEKVPDDSVFTKAFLQALEDTLGNKSGNDKVLTIEEIEDTFHKLLVQEAKPYSPETGAFGTNEDDRGFLFIAPVSQ